MTAYILVRAEVQKESRADFDKWYQEEHLPVALEKFEAAVGAWRAWSDVNDGVHLAFYEFNDLKAAHRLLSSDLMKEFIQEFNRRWEGKVVRSRDTFEVRQSIRKG